MKVAFATQDMQRIDAHFGWAKHIAIYELEADGFRFDHSVDFDEDATEDGNDDKLTPKIEAVKDCAILCVAAIGGMGAARVVNHNVHPMKVTNAEPIEAMLNRLQTVLQGTPPPWLRKAMLKGQERTFDFVDEDEDEEEDEEA